MKVWNSECLKFQEFGNSRIGGLENLMVGFGVSGLIVGVAIGLVVGFIVGWAVGLYTGSRPREEEEEGWG